MDYHQIIMIKNCLRVATRICRLEGSSDTVCLCGADPIIVLIVHEMKLKQIE
jgi:hypothetical protein